MPRKSDLLGIPGIRDDEVRRLTDVGIKDENAFQAILDKESAAFLHDLSQKSGIDRVRIGQLLLNSLQKSAQPILNPILKKHWSDFVLVCLLVFVSLEICWPWLWSSSSVGRVVASSQIAAFSVIQSSQLTVEGVASPAQADKARAPFVGKYALSTLKKGEPIPSEIGRVDGKALAGNIIIRIQVKSMPDLDEQDLPKQVVLILPPAKEPVAQGTVIPALLLGVEKQAKTVTLALRNKESAELFKQPGASDIYLGLGLP